MNGKGYFLKAKRIIKSVLLSAFLLVWSVGMLVGGLYGIVAVALGIPAVIGFTVFQ